MCISGNFQVFKVLHCASTTPCLQVILNAMYPILRSGNFYRGNWETSNVNQCL